MPMPNLAKFLNPFHFLKLSLVFLFVFLGHTVSFAAEQNIKFHVTEDGTTQTVAVDDNASASKFKISKGGQTYAVLLCDSYDANTCLKTKIQTSSGVKWLKKYLDPSCVSQPDGTPCDDANLCTNPDTCQSGVCTGTVNVSCSSICDDKFVVPQVCDPSTGSCIIDNSAAPVSCPGECLNGECCQVDSTVVSGACSGGALCGGQTCTALHTCHTTSYTPAGCATQYTCVPDCPIPPVCTGTPPANADLCTGDDAGLSVDTAVSLVGETSASCTAAKCEYYCSTGYVVPQCKGTDPSNATKCDGDDHGLDWPTAKTSVSSCTAGTKCEYECDPGFILDPNTNTCVDTLCGNTFIDTGEDCDTANLNGNTCTSIPGGFIGGSLACDNTCHFDTSSCTVAPDCGNGNIDGTEDCDGSNLNGNSCTTIPGGFSGGTLACSISCTFDTTNCTAPPLCPNGTIDSGEDCDGSNLNGKTCTTIPGGFTGGSLACSSSCTFDTTNCTAPPLCPNGTIDSGEDCDGSDLNGKTCTTLGLGFDGGTLSCNGSCQFNTSACTSTCSGSLPAHAEICPNTPATDPSYTYALVATCSGSTPCEARCLNGYLFDDTDPSNPICNQVQCVGTLGRGEIICPRNPPPTNNDSTSYIGPVYFCDGTTPCQVTCDSTSATQPYERVIEPPPAGFECWEEYYGCPCTSGDHTCSGSCPSGWFCAGGGCVKCSGFPDTNSLPARCLLQCLTETLPINDKGTLTGDFSATNSGYDSNASCPSGYDVGNPTRQCNDGIWGPLRNGCLQNCGPSTNLDIGGGQTANFPNTQSGQYGVADTACLGSSVYPSMLCTDGTWGPLRNGCSTECPAQDLTISDADPTNPIYLRTFGPSYLNGQTITFSGECPDGNSPSRQCMDGIWGPLVNGCGAQCSSATLDIGSGLNDTFSGPANNNQSVELSCPAGYVGRPTRTCMNGSWGLLRRGCIPSDCTTYDDSTSGYNDGGWYVTYSRTTAGSNQSQLNDYCVGLNQGFAKASLLANSYYADWACVCDSGAAPCEGDYLCVTAACTDPSLEVFFPTTRSGINRHVACPANYEGDPQRLCTNGVWGSLGGTVCTPLTCPNPDSNTQGTLVGNSPTTVMKGATTVLTCNSNCQSAITNYCHGQNSKYNAAFINRISGTWYCGCRNSCPTIDNLSSGTGTKSGGTVTYVNRNLSTITNCTAGANCPSLSTYCSEGGFSDASINTTTLNWNCVCGCPAQDFDIGAGTVTFPATSSGASYTATCPAGYDGSPTSTCRANTWDPLVGTCVRNGNCAATSLPVSSYASSPSLSFGPTNSGDVSTVTCNNISSLGYSGCNNDPVTYEGTASRKCVNGSFGNLLTECTVSDNRTPLDLSPALLPDAFVGEAYSAMIYSPIFLSNSTLAIWSIASGSLPQGFSLCKNDQRSGSCTTSNYGSSQIFVGTTNGSNVLNIPGTYTFKIHAESCGQIAEKTYTLTVRPQPSCPTENKDMGAGLKGDFTTTPINTSCRDIGSCPSCPSGYTGSPTRTCQSNGTWGDLSNGCVKKCPEKRLTISVDGTKDALFPETPAGSSFPITCPANYSSPNAKRSCINNNGIGTWGPLENGCVNSDCVSGGSTTYLVQICDDDFYTSLFAGPLANVICAANRCGSPSDNDGTLCTVEQLQANDSAHPIASGHLDKACPNLHDTPIPVKAGDIITLYGNNDDGTASATVIFRTTNTNTSCTIANGELYRTLNGNQIQQFTAPSDGYIINCTYNDNIATTVTRT